jgi:hypothetical protein
MVVVASMRDTAGGGGGERKSWISPSMDRAASGRGNEIQSEKNKPGDKTSREVGEGTCS